MRGKQAEFEGLIKPMVTKLETCVPSYEAAAAAAPSAMSRSIEIFDRFADARADWLELFALAPASAYQSCDYVSAWFETIGRAEQQEPFIIVARGADGRPLALLPLARVALAPLQLGLFMCGRESNFNLGLFRPGAGYDETAARRLLLEAARQAKRPIDLYYLRNLPRRFDGALNPLASCGAPPSASFAYGATLPGDQAALKARVSKDTRKKLRKKESWLAELGEVRYEHRASGARALEIVRSLLAQKSARLAAMGVSSSFDNSAMRAFLERLGASGGDGALELHALSVSGRIVATYAGLVHRGRFSALLNSFDADEKVARSSPGDLLLHALLADLVARGITKFDLGAGEARYKNAVCDETIELCDLIAAATWKGALAAPLFTALLRAKRRVKQTPWMAAALARARRMLGKGAG
jgi:CelD/BcsL family acetyltransferase involved in cellulose biosynthesis